MLLSNLFIDGKTRIFMVEPSKLMYLKQLLQQKVVQKVIVEPGNRRNMEIGCGNGVQTSTKLPFPARAMPVII